MIMMKLGSNTGSVFNHIDSRSVRGEPAPFVGMGATILHWTDRSAATIIKVETIRGVTYVTTQDDNAVRKDANGMSESQDYEYLPDPMGRVRVFKKHPKSGFWKFCLLNSATGRYVQQKHGSGLKIGVRDEYYDYSF
jgi:hypothetical protein